MSDRDLVLNRHRYWLRAKQSMFALVVLGVASWVATLPLGELHVRIGVAVATVLVGLCVLLLWEVRVMHRTTGFTVFPPGWGTFQPVSGEGAGRFMSLYEFLPLRWRPGGILIGRPLPQQQVLGLFRNAWLGPLDDRHMLTVAGSRSGKGTGALIPNLLVYPGSAVVIDPKGELAQITSRRRGKGGGRVTEALGQDVFIFDPEDIVVGLGGSHRWNPLAELDPGDPHVWGHAARIALALVPMSQQADQEYWRTHARDVLTGLILHVIAVEPPQRRHLIYIRRLVMQGDEELFQLIEDECARTGQPLPYADAHAAMLAYLATSTLHGGKIAGIFRQLAAKAPAELSGVLGALNEQTSFLDEYAMEKSLTASDFLLKDLKLRPTTVYMCLRGSKMSGPLAKIVYVFIDLAITVLERIPGRPPYPVLFAMDEFYCLGANEALDRAIGLVAGYGITLWPVVQHIGQLKRHYPHTWDNFIRNSRGVQVFGDQDPETLKWVEERIGHRVVRRTDGAVERRPLLSTYDLSAYYLNRESRRQLFIPNGRPVAALQLIDYYDRSFPKHWYEDDPRANERSLYEAWPEVV